MAQIENRYWMVYASRSSRTQILEARNLADARSKANTLRRVGSTIKAISRFQAQVAEESLQGLFDGAGTFKLTSGKSELVLGNVLEAGADKVVLERGGAKITFLRP